MRTTKNRRPTQKRPPWVLTTARTTGPIVAGDHTIPSLPPEEAKLTAKEEATILTWAHALKRLGIEPHLLIRNQFLAEVAYRFLKETEDASVPDVLRMIVINSANPDVQSVDALDAPSVRIHLKLARSWRKYAGDVLTKDGTSFVRDLDACADAVALAPLRGGQSRPLVALLLDQLDYWIYAKLQRDFASRTGTPAPDFEQRVRHLWLSEVTALWARFEKAGELSSQELNDALLRQVEAFKAAKGTKGGLSPADHCALALWEFKVGTPATEKDLYAAQNYVRRVQHVLRLLKRRSKPRRPSKT